MVGLSVGPFSQLCRCVEGFVREQFLSREILAFPDDLRQAAVPGVGTEEVDDGWWMMAGVPAA